MLDGITELREQGLSAYLTTYGLFGLRQVDRDLDLGTWSSDKMPIMSPFWTWRITCGGYLTKELGERVVSVMSTRGKQYGLLHLRVHQNYRYADFWHRFS